MLEEWAFGVIHEQFFVRPVLKHVASFRARDTVSRRLHYTRLLKNCSTTSMREVDRMRLQSRGGSKRYACAITAGTVCVRLKRAQGTVDQHLFLADTVHGRYSGALQAGFD